MQYEKATAPRNRNRRNGPRGSACASRDLIRHPNRSGLSSSAPGLRSAAGLCTSRPRGTASVRGPEADLPTCGGRAGTGLLCPAAGRLLRTPRPRLEASAPAPWALRALLSSLTTDGERGVVERAAKAGETWNRGADRNRSAPFVCANFFVVTARSRLQLAVTLSSFSGQNGYARTRNQRRAAYTP